MDLRSVASELCTLLSTTRALHIVLSHAQLSDFEIVPLARALLLNPHSSLVSLDVSANVFASIGHEALWAAEWERSRKRPVKIVKSPSQYATQRTHLYYGVYAEDVQI
jgi:hypothetical protein